MLILTRKIIEAEKISVNDRKTFYKLMQNDVYGKTIENVRNVIDIKLVSNKEDTTNRYQNEALCHKKDLVTIHKGKVTLKFNKPAYVGMSVLNLSKVLIYKFYQT